MKRTPSVTFTFHHRFVSCPKLVWGVLLFALCVSARSEAKQETGATKRLATVTDGIEMTRWADPSDFVGGRPGPVGLFSPDGKKFLVVVRKGNIERQRNDYSLLLFRTKDALDHPKPRVLLTMSSASNRDAISGVKWLRDNESMIFLGEQQGTVPQVYRFNIRTNELDRLTDQSTPVVAYDASEDGNRLIYESDPPVKRVLQGREVREKGIVVTTQYPSDLMIAGSSELTAATATYKDLYVKERGKPPSRVATNDFVVDNLPLSMSPDGSHAVVPVYLANVPELWSEYNDRLLHAYITERRKPGIPFNIQQYMIVDTKTLRIVPLLNSPISWHNAGSAWNKSGDSVVLSGVYLSLDLADPMERELREQQSFVVEVSISGRFVTKVTDRAVGIVRWDRPTGTLILQPESGRGPELEETYRKVGSAWSRLGSGAEGGGVQDSVELTLEEALNTPPRIFAANPRTNQKSLLLDLNPQFQGILFASEEVVNWNATDGHKMTGGLYLPPDFRRATRYPLVIQTHGFDKSRFVIDGPYSSAFAAQALAASGFVVLQVGHSADPDQDTKFLNTPEEAPRQMAAYEGAIDYLDSRGLIDRNRVGIIGFSRTVFYAAYTLTHSKYKFAAATLADGFDGGYMNYLLWRDPADYDAVIGGPPTGAALASWLRNSPGFNLDKVTAAVRLEYYGPIGPLDAWQWYAGLSYLEKPVDFIWLPFGTHLLVKPSERFTSLAGNVSWFKFWLKGEESSDPNSKQQNERWEQLRALKSRELPAVSSQ